jgi:ATP-binding cassette subfamily C protein
MHDSLRQDIKTLIAKLRSRPDSSNPDSTGCLAYPFLSYVRADTLLLRGAAICLVLYLLAAAAEIVLATSLVPVISTLGVESGESLKFLDDRVSPVAWLLLFALAAGLRTFANWLSTVKTEETEQKLVVSLQSRLYRALASAHWDTVRRVSPPTITSALQTQSYDAAYGFSSLVQVVAAAMLISGYLVAAALVFPLLLPVLLGVLIFMLSFNRSRSERALSYSEEYVGATTDLHQRYEDWVSVSRISSLGVSSGILADRFESGAYDAASRAVGFSRSAASTRASYDTALIVSVLVGVPLAWWLDSPPALLAFGLVAIVRVLPRAAGIHSGYQSIVAAVAPLQAVVQLARVLERDPVESSYSAALLDWKRLEFVDVGVEEGLINGKQRWILQDVDLDLREGEWLAITGPTGAGKTTLAEVMLMLVRPDSGELRIDGQAVDGNLANAWRNAAGYVPQDVVLFDASIRDNLCVYAPDAADAELQAALAHAAADFVFERLPDGLDTRVGPGGRWLSGGERQRIGIARALLKKPGFLVLDEPTAALDSDTTGKLMDSLAGLKHAMSVVVITHRPELLRLADRIIGLEDGRISRRGDGSRRNDPGLRRR